jgi:hypothetical protein
MAGDDVDDLPGRANPDLAQDQAGPFVTRRFESWELSIPRPTDHRNPQIRKA